MIKKSTAPVRQHRDGKISEEMHRLQRYCIIFGQPILKSLKPNAYFRTYNEAYAVLVEYNKNPYDLDADISVAELYEKWTDDYFEKISATSMRTIQSNV